jgi:hypothetical protein
MEQIVEGKRGRGRPRLPQEKRLNKSVNFWVRSEEYQKIAEFFPDEAMSDVLRRGLQLAIQEAQSSSRISA